MSFEKLQESVFENNINIEDNKLNKLKEYWDLLLKFNDKIHLFSRKEPELELAREFYEVILLNVFLPDYGILIDAGAGAGFVGIILSILNDNKNFILVERSSKKSSFLDLAMLRLNLNNVVVYSKDILHIHEEADVVVSKASCMRETIERLLTELLRVGGILVHFSSVSISPPYRSYRFKNPFRKSYSYIAVMERVM